MGETTTNYWYKDGSSSSGTIVADQQVWWQRTLYRLENGTSIYSDWHVVLGNPNFQAVDVPDEAGFVKRGPVGAMYADPNRTWRENSSAREDTIHSDISFEEV